MVNGLNASFKSSAACPYLDADGALLPDIRHKTLMGWLEDHDIDALDIKTCCALFTALKGHVYFSADQNQYIQTTTYEHPEFGPFTKPAIDESQYKWEIALMHKLSAELSYTPHMQDTIAAATGALMDEMLDTPAFTDNIARGSFLTPEARLAAGENFCKAFTLILRRTTKLDIQGTPLLPLDAPADDPALFFGQLLHAKIHNFCDNLADLQAREKMDWSSRFAQDAELSFLRRKFRVGNVDFINSLYFTDAEEVMCYRNQKSAEARMRHLTPAGQTGYTPAPAQNPQP